MINKLSKEIYQANVKKGFYDDEKNLGEMLALIHSEVSEALEADRKHIYAPKSSSFYGIIALSQLKSDAEFKMEFDTTVKDTFQDELADIMIRVMDLAAHKDINLEAHIEAKMRYNALRPHKHGKKY
jgi:NTP pyrophosphatase (non-canonical NTP hydrolase)